LREQTEWVEIVEHGTARLVGANQAAMVEAFMAFQESNSYTYPPLFGNGRAAEEICRLMLENL
jgi:UDP-N-acetylglucosamine 2-epimerase